MNDSRKGKTLGKYLWVITRIMKVITRNRAKELLNRPKPKKLAWVGLLLEIVLVIVLEIVLGIVGRIRVLHFIATAKNITIEGAAYIANDLVVCSLKSLSVLLRAAWERP